MASVDILSVAKDAFLELGPSWATSITLLTAAAPLALLGWISLMRAGFFLSLLVGAAMGLAWMGLGFFMQKRRSQERMKKARIVGYLATMDRGKLEQVLEKNNMPIPPWCTYPEFEKVEWLNKQVKEVWPYLDKATCTTIKDALTPTLESYKVGIIKTMKVTDLTLGDIGPTITGVRTYRSGDDEVTLEAEIDWMHGKASKAVLEVETKVVADLTVKVSNIGAKLAIKAIFKPLCDKMPGFGAVMFCLREDPILDMDIGIEGASLTAIPGIDKMIDNIINTSLRDMLVWPARMVFPVAEGDYTYLELHPTGYLEIVLLEAKNVPKTDMIGKTDPFVYFFVRQKQGAMKRSSTKDNNSAPVWNEIFFIEVEDVSFQTLTVRLMDDEAVEKSEYIGSRLYELNQLTPKETKDVQIDMVGDPAKPDEGQKRGTVHFYITYHPYNSEEDAKNSPAHLMEQAVSKKKVDGLPYAYYKEHGFPEEPLSSDDEAEIPVGAGESRGKKTGKIRKVVDKVFHHKSGKEQPVQLEGMQEAEQQVVEGGSTDAHAGKIKPESGGAGF